ncbi:MAG: DotU family type IV/VI secretion system protein [Holosporales bacterium]|jgi:type VI secretion system protein ImpK|nr:DotU family type IV/VI secretion system protein [Holosporales bacterium]
MIQFRASDSPIVHGFQAFYYELLKQKEICLSHFFKTDSVDPSDAATISDSQSSTEVETMIVKVQKEIISVINKVFDILSRKSRTSSKKLEEAKYIMTALADEVFINIRWEGAKFWRFSLLEKQMFQSEISGEKFFLNLDEFIVDSNNTNDEIAFLYLMSLSLGFKGRYRGAENEHEYLSWYKDKLYSILHSKSSKLFYPGRTNMIEQCYENTFVEESKESLPNTRFWSMCISSIVAVYIVISFAVWFGITDEISDILNSIAEIVRKEPLV